MDPKEHLAARSKVLSAHAEEMVSLIRFHVGQCPTCREQLCAEGMPALVQRLDRALRELRDAVAEDAREPPSR